MNTERFRQEGYRLVGAAFDVYHEIGHGFLEEVYHECLQRELTSQRIPWTSKPCVSIFYKGALIQPHYTPDFLVFGEIIVELKAAKALAPEHEAQLLNYLKASRKRVGYLLNFGSHPKLEWRRFIMDHPSPLIEPSPSGLVSH